MTEIVIMVLVWLCYIVVYALIACAISGCLWVSVCLIKNAWAGVMDLRICIDNVNKYLRRRNEFETWMKEHTMQTRRDTDG